MKITSVSFFSMPVEDRAGEMAHLTKVLREENLDLAGLWGFGIGQGRAQIIAVPKDAEHFRGLIPKLGIEVIEGTCFRLTENDRVGALVDILDSLAQKGINLHAVDAISVAGEFGCYIWSDENNVDTIRELLDA